MNSRRDVKYVVGLLVSAAAGFCAAATPVTGSPEAEYAAGLHEIMVRMDAGMMAMSPASTVDRQFITAMLPHHQAAIDMAQLQLRYGHDARLARIAQEIIVEQQQEMVVMNDVLRTVP